MGRLRTSPDTPRVDAGMDAKSGSAEEVAGVDAGMDAKSGSAEEVAGVDAVEEMGAKNWTGQTSLTLRDWSAFTTMTNFLLFLSLLALHLVTFHAAKLGFERIFEEESALPWQLAMACQIFLALLSLLFSKRLLLTRSRPKKAELLPYLAQSWPDAQQTARLEDISALMRRPAAPYDPLNDPYDRFIRFLTTNRSYLAVPFDPDSLYAHSVLRDLDVLGIEPTETLAQIPKSQVSKMCFPNLYKVGEAVRVFSVTLETIQLFAALPRSDHQLLPAPGKTEKEDFNEEAVN